MHAMAGPAHLQLLFGGLASRCRHEGALCTQVPNHALCQVLGPARCPGGAVAAQERLAHWRRRVQVDMQVWALCVAAQTLHSYTGSSELKQEPPRSRYVGTQLQVSRLQGARKHSRATVQCLVINRRQIRTLRKKVQTGMSAGAWACCSGHAASLHCPASQPGQTATLLSS